MQNFGEPLILVSFFSECKYKYKHKYKYKKQMDKFKEKILKKEQVCIFVYQEV